LILFTKKVALVELIQILQISHPLRKYAHGQHKLATDGESFLMTVAENISTIMNIKKALLKCPLE